MSVPQDTVNTGRKEVYLTGPSAHWEAVAKLVASITLSLAKSNTFWFLTHGVC